jgi:hypothetical protein
MLIKSLLINTAKLFLLAPKLFKRVRKLLVPDLTFDIALTEQVLLFSLLRIFLLSHKGAYKHKIMGHALQGIDDLHLLTQHIRESMAMSLYLASLLMLSMRHIDVNLIKQLSRLDKVSQLGVKGSEKDDLVLFMLSCLYFAAPRHCDFSTLEQKAELLNIQNLVK